MKYPNGSIIIVIPKHAKTMIVEKIPKLLIGMIGLIEQDANATELVTDVTSIYMNAFLTTRDILSIGRCLIAFTHIAFFQQSWKTKISSHPIPTIIIIEEICREEK
jgi:hypothetical protein